MNEIDVRDAYFAGLIDGEGCIGLYRRSDKKTDQYRAFIEVKMTCEQTVRALCSHFGVGQFTYRPPQREGWKAQWRWRVTDAAARSVAVRISPHMITKKFEVDALIGHWRGRGL